MEKKEKIIEKITSIMKDVRGTTLSQKSGVYLFIYYDSVEEQCYVTGADDGVKTLNEISQKDLKKIYQDLAEDFL